MSLLTILIPTCNRPDRLSRLLAYLASIRQPFPVWILDSSAEGRGGEAAVSNGIHKQFPPSTPLFEKLHAAVQEVSSPYVVLWADDDFMVPAAFEQGVAFLETHPSFALVHGHSGIFGVGQGAGGGHEISFVSRYLQRSIEEASGAERLLTHLAPYTTTFYSIHRTPMLAKNLRRTLDYDFGYGFGELVPSCLSVIQGKTHTMPRLYMLREIHNGRDTLNPNPGTHSVFDWMTNPQFAANYAKLLECLGDELAQTDRIAVQTAREVVRTAFWVYLRQRLEQTWNGSRRSGMKDHLKRFTRLTRSWQWMRSFAPGAAQRMTLQALQRTTSPHHADFLPIRQAIGCYE